MRSLDLVLLLRREIRILTCFILASSVFAGQALEATVKTPKIAETGEIAEIGETGKTGKTMGNVARKDDIPEGPSRAKRRHVLHISPLIQLSYGRDKGFSLLARSVLIGGVKLGYDYRGYKIQNELAVAGGAGPAYPPYVNISDEPTDIIPLPDTAAWFHFAEAFLFHLAPQKSRESPWRFSLGGELAFDVSAWIPAERLNYGFFLSVELKPLARLSWQPHHRHSLRADITLPLVGLGWRPPWSGVSALLEKNSEQSGMIAALFTYPYFLFWHNNQNFRLRLRYEWQLSDGFSLSAQYEHLVQLNQAVQPYALFHNRFYLGIEIKPGSRRKRGKK
ncbi:MAG: hypothetical protein AAF975_02255 [Spirochaetota bacterium]